MKKIYILAALVILAFTACQTKFEDPESDGVYKKMVKSYTLNEDGSMVYHYQHQLKYLTHYAFNRLYGESFIVYNPEYQELKINKSETTMKDGKKVQSPENAFNEVLPRFAAGAPDYNHLREMVVTHTGLEVGCEVDFDYEIHTSSGYYPCLDEKILIGNYTPVHQLEIVVKIPENKTLNYKLLHADIEPKISNAKGFKVFQWNFSGLKDLKFSDNMPKSKVHVPQLIFSTASYAEILPPIHENWDIHDDIVDASQDQLKDANTDFDKLFALQDMIVNDMNHLNIPFEHTGYSVRNAERVWKSNGATTLEKTFLLSSLINKNGIKATPVICYPDALFDPSIGLMTDIGKAMVLVEIDGEKILSDATSNKTKNNPLLKFENKTLVDFDGNKVDLGDEESAENALTFVSDLNLSEQGIVSGKISGNVNGFIYPYYNLLKDEKMGKKVLSSYVPSKAIKDFDLKEWDNKGCSFDASVKCKEFVKRQENYLFLTLPESSLGIASSDLATLTEKRYVPLALNTAIDEQYIMNLQLPAGYKLVTHELDSLVENQVGKLHIKITETGNQLEIIRKIKINQSIIDPEDYADFRVLYLGWIKDNRKEIILKKTD